MVPVLLSSFQVASASPLASRPVPRRWSVTASGDAVCTWDPGARQGLYDFFFAASALANSRSCGALRKGCFESAADRAGDFFSFFFLGPLDSLADLRDVAPRSTVTPAFRAQLWSTASRRSRSTAQFFAFFFSRSAFFRSRWRARRPRRPEPSSRSTPASSACSTIASMSSSNSGSVGMRW